MHNATLHSSVSNAHASLSAALGRRQFLHRLTVGAAVASAFPAILPRARGQNSPGRKLNIAGIGLGGQGSGDINALQSENIVALCDVDQDYAARVFKKYPQARRYVDFRKMLDEVREIDAVVVATPDHLHAVAAMDALRRGKHVYCEKPLTHSVWEARQLGQAARQLKLATQMGNQGQASAETRRRASGFGPASLVPCARFMCGPTGLPVVCSTSTGRKA